MEMIKLACGECVGSYEIVAFVEMVDENLINNFSLEKDERSHMSIRMQ